MIQFQEGDRVMVISRRPVNPLYWEKQGTIHSINSYNIYVFLDDWPYPGPVLFGNRLSLRLIAGFRDLS